MKKTTLILLSTLFSTLLSAQVFNEGDIFVSLGYGTPNLGKSVLNLYDDEDGFDAKGFGPLHAKFEYGITEKIGIGLSVNHVNFSGEWTEASLDGNGNSVNYNYKFSRNATAANLRVNWHFSNSDVVDAYWGFGIGYNRGVSKWTTNEPNFDDGSIGDLIPLGFETTLGIRAMFTDNIGVYGEVGLAKSLIQGGLVVKI